MVLKRRLCFSGSDDEDDNDIKSDKSDDDNDEEAKVKEQTEEGATPPPEGGDPQPRSDLQQEEEQQQKKKKKQSRQDKDAEYQARITELLLRVEPVGLDRHHRKYWLLSGEHVGDTDHSTHCCYEGKHRSGARSIAIIIVRRVASSWTVGPRLIAG